MLKARAKSNQLGRDTC